MATSAPLNPPELSNAGRVIGHIDPDRNRGRLVNAR